MRRDDVSTAASDSFAKTFTTAHQHTHFGLDEKRRCLCAGDHIATGFNSDSAERCVLLFKS
jgi:hypothetical protein